MRNIIILLGILVIGAVGFLFYQDKAKIPVAEKCRYFSQIQP